MISEPEENADPASEPNPEPSEKDGDVPSVPKENNNEQAKPKKRRRGKKRKHRKERCGSENPGESEHENLDSPPWDSDEDLSCDVHSFTDVIIRPINVPKAPENSTQFIMDDHQECRLYMSFETPESYLSNPPRIVLGDIVEPGEDAAYRDIDYEYESPQDFDNSAYYDREFEQSYKNNRFDELMRLPRAELLGMLHSLESRSKELHDDLVKENPSPMLDKLQHELLELQEKHNVLQEHNAKLTALVTRGQGGETEGTAEPRSSLSSESYSPVHDPSYPLSKFVDNDSGIDARSYWNESRLFGERSDSPDFEPDGAGPYEKRSESLCSEPFVEDAGPSGGGSESPFSESRRLEAGPSGERSESPDSVSGGAGPYDKRSESPCSEPCVEDAGPSGEGSESPFSESRKLEAGPSGKKSESSVSRPRRSGSREKRSESLCSEPFREDAGPSGEGSGPRRLEAGPTRKRSESSGSRSRRSGSREEKSESSDCGPVPDSRSLSFENQTNNVDGVVLNVAFREKCSSVVARDEEQLSASETGVV